jgi:amino acid permease
VLIIGGFLLGALLGPLRAMKLGGRKIDALHYGAAFALIGALIGLFATIIITRMA